MCVHCKTAKAEPNAALCANCRRDLIYKTAIERTQANAQLQSELNVQRVRKARATPRIRTEWIDVV